MPGIEGRNTQEGHMDAGGDGKVGNWNGSFSFRQIEFEVPFRIQVKLSSVLPITHLLYSTCGLVLNQSMTPVRTYSMFFSVIRE